MIKSALEYIVGLRKPEIQEIDGQVYSDKELHRIKHNPKAEAFNIYTLTSLIDYLTNDKIDQINREVVVHVASPTDIRVFTSLDNDAKRDRLVNVTAMIPDFRYDCWYDHESFCIALQSKFVKNDDRDLLLKFAGTVESGTVAEYGDDGISQKATIKTGIAKKGDCLVPNPVSLIPYRTFPEIEQPESQFVFRMRDNGSVQCAIFEADGGAWRNKAMKSIADYLKEHLPECYLILY